MTATADPAAGLTQRPLWPHQAAAFEALRDERAKLIDGEMGVAGKTNIAIALLEHDYAYRHDNIAPDGEMPFRVLVLAPKSVLGVWPARVADFAASGWTAWSGEVYGRNGKLLRNPSVARRAETLIQATTNAARLRRPFMAVVGYEASWQGDMARALLGTPWDALILDESHRVSAPGGKTSRHVAQIAARVRARGGRILGLSGTVFPHSPLDIYGQGRAIDPSVFGTNNTRFKARYAGRMQRVARGGESIFLLGKTNPAVEAVIEERARLDGSSFAVIVDGAEVGVFDDRFDAENEASNQRSEALWIAGQKPTGAVLRKARPGEPIYMVGPRLEQIYEGVDESRFDEFTQRAGRLIYRIPREGLDAYLGLPEAVDVFRSIELDPATRRAYDSLEKDLIARVGDGAVTAANAMVLVLRLAQVASGYAPTIGFDGIKRESAGRLSDHPLPEKARLLADVLEDLPTHEPVVVFCRFHHDLDAVARVAEMQGRSYGELSGRRRDGLTDAGTMAAVDVLGAQIKSGGVGIDLTRARYGIYYTLGFELADYLQSRKRLHRPGQTRPVTYVHLLAEGTVERAIYGALKRRQRVVDTVLKCLGGGAR